jgi:hypothetical protein
MVRYAEASVDTPEWLTVSSAQPCPVCGGTSRCSVQEAGEFGRCLEVVSDWPVVTGGRLHRLERLSSLPA